MKPKVVSTQKFGIDSGSVFVALNLIGQGRAIEYHLKRIPIENGLIALVWMAPVTDATAPRSRKPATTVINIEPRPGQDQHDGTTNSSSTG